MAVIIQMRRDTSTTWGTVNPVLYEGEFGVETDTLKIKVGNGTSTWNTLPYISEGNELDLADLADWPASVSATEVGYLDGVTSGLQTQINNKIFY
jgi:hypothetical protein